MPAPKHSVENGVEWFKFSSGVWEAQRTREQDDLRCQTAEGMWPKDAQEMRSACKVAGIAIPARPMLSIPTMDEPVQLQINGQRKAHLAINVHALSEDATDDTAEVYQGLFRAYERFGRAHLARAWAFNRKVKCGTGWYRMLKVYDPDGGHPLDQKIIPKRILYQNAVLPDPFAEEMDWSDGKRLQYVADLPLATYKQRYKDSQLNGNDATDDATLQSLGNEAADWIGGSGEASRTVRVCEEYVIEIEIIRKHLLDDNSMATDDTIPDGRTKKTGNDAQYQDDEVRHLWRRVFSCFETLEPWAEQDGQFIPFVFDPGDELQPVDGKRIWEGIYAKAKQSAQLVNYAASAAVEMAALEPKAPWQGEEGIFEGHEEEYRQSNMRNFPYLQYRRVGLAGVPAEAPKRVQVDVSRLGPSMQLLGMGREFVQTSTATFDPALGKQPTAHRSGRALIALQDQTIEATSGYLENHKDIAITHEARIFLDLAPFVYDRPGRIARILGEDGKTTIVMFKTPYMIDPKTQRPRAVNPIGDPAAVAANTDNPIKYVDLSKGRYGVSFTIGKSQGDRLQQGSEEMGDLLSADPALMPILGPTYFKFRDFPGAKAISKILEKMRDHQFPWLADQPQQDAAAQLAKAQSDLAQLTQAATEMKKDLDTERVKQDGQVAIAKLKFDLELEIVKVQNAAKIEIARITAAKQSADLEREAEEEAIALGREHAHEVSTIDQEHQNALAQADQANQHAIQQGDLGHQQAVIQNEQSQAHALENTAAQPTEPTE